MNIPLGFATERFQETAAIPWFLPGVAVSVVAGAVASAWVARKLGIGRGLAWAIVASFGVILSATLTPSREAVAFGLAGGAGCDLSRIGPLSLADLLTINDASLNVALFLPIGISIGLVRRSPAKVLLVAAAIVLPFAIEATQMLVPVLDRACQSSDVADNLTGLVVGLAAGTAGGWIASGLAEPPAREDAAPFH